MDSARKSIDEGSGNTQGSETPSAGEGTLNNEEEAIPGPDDVLA